MISLTVAMCKCTGQWRSGSLAMGCIASETVQWQIALSRKAPLLFITLSKEDLRDTDK